MDACIDDVPISHSSKLFAKVSTMLILDIFDNRIPAIEVQWYSLGCNVERLDKPIFIVDLIPVTGSVHDVQSQSDTIFDNDCDHKSTVVTEICFRTYHEIQPEFRWSA